jgi:L-ascorbate metabolism protein UlaG (beta-lactamase superfamily)
VPGREHGAAPPHHQRALELGRANARRATPRYRSIVLHWLARMLRRAAPASSAPLPDVEAGQVAVTWGGHATVLVRYQRLAILCDPMLGGSVRGVPREVAPGLDDAALAGVELCLVSHADPDHLHLPTLARLPRRATVVVPPGAGAQLSRLRFARLIELAPGNSFDQAGVRIEALPVRHGDRASPAQAYALRGDGPSVYFCAASGYFSGFAEVGRRSPPDVALLPIAGYAPAAFRDRHLSPLDALFAFEDLRARLMVPIGFGSFALSYERLEDPERWMTELVATRGLDAYVSILQPGESRVFVGGGEPEVDIDVDGDAEEGAPSRQAGASRGAGAGDTARLWGAAPVELAATPASR